MSGGGDGDGLRPAYVRLDAVAASASEMVSREFALQAGPLERYQGHLGERVVVSGDEGAGGQADGSWIDRAIKATDGATDRQHELQEAALDEAIERRVSEYGKRQEAKADRAIVQRQREARLAAAERKGAIAAEYEPELSDMRLRLRLLERRASDEPPLTDGEKQAMQALRQLTKDMEAERAERMSAVDERLAAQLPEIKSSERAAAGKAVDEFRQKESADAGETAEDAQQRLDALKKETRERLLALHAAVEPATKPFVLPAPPNAPADAGGERSLARAQSRLASSRRRIADVTRWQVAEYVKVAGRARGFEIRFERPPGAEWPDVTDSAREWLQAEPGS